MRMFLFAAALSLALLPASAQSATGPAISGQAVAAQSDAATPFSVPAHPATITQIQQIMALSHSDEGIRRQLQAGIADQQKNGPKFIPASFWEDFKLQIEKTDWLTFFTPIYQRYYSTEDATELIRFYSTPAGQKLILASQPFLTEVVEKSRQLGREIGAGVGAKHPAEIQTLMKQNTPDSSLPAILTIPPPPPPAVKQK